MRSICTLVLVGMCGAVVAAEQQGKTTEKTLLHGGLNRVYRIHIPPTYDGSKPVPLVFVLHGGGERGFARTAELGFGFNPLSDKHGFIVVYPNSADDPCGRGRRRGGCSLHCRRPRP